MRARWLIPLALFACARAEGGPKGPRGPVIVELFTSQGCSSCPPADKILAQLATRTDVVPLSFHVDYWDELGWPDPYAKEAWTSRQRQYARALGDRSVYTPELVVGGAVGMVGSHGDKIAKAIDAATVPALLATTATWSASALEVEAKAPAGTEVWLAIYEERATNKVTRGENSGETLQHVHVVRALEKVDKTRTIKLDPAWRNVRTVVFAQRPDRVIVASSSLAR